MSKASEGSALNLQGGFGMGRVAYMSMFFLSKKVPIIPKPFPPQFKPLRSKYALAVHPLGVVVWK